MRTMKRSPVWGSTRRVSALAFPAWPGKRNSNFSTPVRTSERCAAGSVEALGSITRYTTLVGKYALLSPMSPTYK